MIDLPDRGPSSMGGGPDAQPFVLGLRTLIGRGSGVVGWSAACALLDGAGAVVSARALGVDGRGLYAVALTVATVFTAIACFGVPTVGRVRLASDLALSSYLSVIPVHALVGGALCLAATQGLVVVVLHQGGWTLSVAAGATAMGTVCSTFVFDALNGFGDHQRAVASNASGSCAALIGAAIVGELHATPTSFMTVLGASQIVQTSVALIWLGSRGNRRGSYSAMAHSALLRSGVSAMPFQVSTFATFRLDRYIVAAVGGVGAAGIYAVAATVSEATRILPLSFGQVLMFGRSSGQVSASAERRVRRLVLAVTWFALAALALCAPIVIRVLFGSSYLPGVTALRVLLLGEVMLAAWLLDNRLLAGSGRFGAASTTTAASAIIVVVADVALIPHYGLIGAAVASVVAYTAAALLARRFLRNTLNTSPQSPD